MQLLLLSMSAHMTKELGMAPGGEFRRAVKEVIYDFCLLLIFLFQVLLKCGLASPVFFSFRKILIE